MTTPSNQSSSPLYPHVIQRLEDNRIIASSSAATMSPASFLVKDETVSAGNAVVTRFWVEAHALSCFKRVSFWSSLETTFDDTMSSLLNENGDDRREMALENVWTKVVDECATIDPHGNILNDSGDKKSFTLAVCIVDRHTTCTRTTHWTTQQAQAVATFCGLQLSRNTANLRRASGDTKEEMATTTTTNQSQASSSWVQYVTLPVRTISHGISYAIDSILGDEYTLRLNADSVSSHHPSFAEELDDESSSSKTAINVLNQIDEDDAALIAKGVAGATLNHLPWDITDNIISIGAIVSSCRYLLSYTNQILLQDSDDREEFFFLCDAHGNTDRIILHKHGFGRGSIVSMCRHCGNYFTADATTMGIDESNKLLQHNVGNLLSNVSEDGVNLLAETLVKAQYAFMDEETITLFPNGIPPNFTKCKSDHALFQMHNTKSSIQHRMQQLERDVETAKQHAVTAHRKGMTRSALVHMKRRRAAMEELERCASLISNLDASELRLQRAKDDVQLVQTYSMLKTALQEIRTSSGIGDVDVEELMLDIQEEMEATSLESFSVDAIGPEIDEDELNEEFRQLELECAVEKNVSESIVGRESVQARVIEEVTGHKEVEAIQTPQKKGPLQLHG